MPLSTLGDPWSYLYLKKAPSSNNCIPPNRIDILYKVVVHSPPPTSSPLETVFLVISAMSKRDPRVNIDNMRLYKKRSMSLLKLNNFLFKSLYLSLHFIMVDIFLCQPIRVLVYVFTTEILANVSLREIN